MGSNLRLQSGCHDCKLAFVKEEYESTDEIYCTLDAPARPKCMSVFMGELADQPFSDESNAEHEAWDAWASGRLRHPAQVCDCHVASQGREP